MVKTDLTKAEIEWIINEIEITVDSIRIDDDIGSLTFYKNNFKKEDYYNIKFIEKLFRKMIPLIGRK